MARQTGDIKIVGTLDEICFYQMEGDYFARLKSSLTKERFWKDQAFENSRNSCDRFGTGNRLASRVYKKLTKEQKKNWSFCFFRTRAIYLLKTGLSEEEVVNVMLNSLVIKKRAPISKAKQKRQPEKRFECKRVNPTPLPSLLVFGDKKTSFKKSKAYTAL